MFELEEKTYQRLRPTLPPGKFALIRGEDLVGLYDTQEAALSAGTERFGLTALFIRKVGDEVMVVSAPALSLGILRAHSQPALPGGEPIHAKQKRGGVTWKT